MRKGEIDNKEFAIRTVTLALLTLCGVLRSIHVGCYVSREVGSHCCAWDIPWGS